MDNENPKQTAAASEYERDLDQEMTDAVAALVDVIKAHPREWHGEMCVGAFRALQMDVRPAPAPGLWNTPARPDPRRLIPDGYVSGGNEGVYLDKQLLQFVDIVASMVADYPEQHREQLCLDFYEELLEGVGGHH